MATRDETLQALYDATEAAAKKSQEMLGKNNGPGAKTASEAAHELAAAAESVSRSNDA